MKYLLTLLLQFIVISTLLGQQKNTKPILISSKIGVIPFNLGGQVGVYYHFGETNALGLDLNSYISEPRIRIPNSGGIGPDLPFSSYTETSSNYMIKYISYPWQDIPSYFQLGFSSAIGITQHDRIVGYDKTSSGGFFSFTSYNKIYRRETQMTYQIGIQVIKRKRKVNYFLGLDIQMYKYQQLLLFTTGLQINFFKK